MSSEGVLAEWFARIEDDERTAEILLQEGGPTSVIAFHCQQMAEKSLKAVLVWAHKEFEKIHDLVELGVAVREIAPHIEDLRDELELLRPYYIPTRYPGDYPELTTAQATAAFEAAQRVKAFAFEQTRSR